VSCSRRTTERFVAIVVSTLAATFSGCKSTHRGFGKGKSVGLHVSKIVEIRCARPVVDAEHKTVAIAWVAAKAPDERPQIEQFELTVFDDRDGDQEPDAGEILVARTNPAPSHYIVFGPFEATSTSSIESLRGLVQLKTAYRGREVNWQLMRREDFP
jgi:hypothetical protein